MPSNAELHRKMDEALSAGDLGTVRDLIAEDVVNHMPGTNPFAGDHQGREAFFELLDEALAGGSMSVEHREILDGEGHSVALSTMSADRKGRTLRGDVLDLCRWRDGRVVEEWVLPFDQRAWDEFWS